MKIFSLFALLIFKTFFCNASLTSDIQDGLESLGNTIVFLKEQDSSGLPIYPPLSDKRSILEEDSEFYVRERILSTTGEDFDVYLEEKPFLKVRGSIFSNIPGIDYLNILLFEEEGAEEAKQVAKLIRKGDAIVVYRDTEAYFDSEAICWIFYEDHKFRVYSDSKRLNLIYYFSGQFFDRDIIMKNVDQEPVAKIDEKTITGANVMSAAADMAGVGNEAGLEDVQNYVVKVAKGMDVILALACTIAIDETYDDARKAEREEAKEEL